MKKICGEISLKTHKTAISPIYRIPNMKDNILVIFFSPNGLKYEEGVLKFHTHTQEII